MSAPRVLDVEVDLADATQARHVARALSMEETQVPVGTKVHVRADGASLKVRLEAEDTRGLRAATNSFLRLVSVAIQTADAVPPSKSGPAGP